METIYVVLIVIITALVAAAVGYLLRKQTAERKLGPRKRRQNTS